MDAALSFVIRRVREQANLSGEPLTEEQLQLLKYLPSPTGEYWEPESPTPVPRNRNYERLCALGRAAYLRDRKSSPSSLDWEFALAVFQLERHPMWGVLQFAGVKYRRPRWDYLLLVLSGLLFVTGMLVLALLAGNEPWTGLQWTAMGSAFAAALFLAYFGARRIERRQLEKEIERCRLGSQFVSAMTSNATQIQERLDES